LGAKDWAGQADDMRGLISLIVIIYLVGVGVALAPVVQEKWNSAIASDFVASIGDDLPYALAWPARLYRSIAGQG
jgi:hypothetical protein